MMDFWQMISLALPFLEVILHTTLQNVKKKEKGSIKTVRPLNQSGMYFQTPEKKSREEIIRTVASYAITIIYGLVLIGFFLIGFLSSWK